MSNWTVSAWPILVSAALKSTLVLGAAWLITVLLRKRSAAARHVVWAAGIAIAMLQMLVACVALWRTRRAAKTSQYAALAARLARDIGIKEDVHILEVPSGMPMTFGVLRPTVLVPSCAADWSEDRR